MEKINLVVSQNLMHIRKEQQLSLEKLASISGVSRAMLNQIEKDNRIRQFLPSGKYPTA